MYPGQLSSMLNGPFWNKLFPRYSELSWKPRLLLKFPQGYVRELQKVHKAGFSKRKIFRYPPNISGLSSSRDTAVRAGRVCHRHNKAVAN